MAQVARPVVVWRYILDADRSDALGLGAYPARRG